MKVELTEMEISWLQLGQKGLVPSSCMAEELEALRVKLALARESAKQGWRVIMTDGHNG